MARLKIVQTLESILARTDEVGECLEWQGMVRNGTPQIRVDRKMKTVRRLIRELLGKPAKPGNFLASSCRNPKCVNPEHIVERSPGQHQREMALRVEHNHPIRIAKLQKAKAHTRVISDEGLAMIHADTRRAEDLARELGCSKSLVNKIRRGAAYRQVSAAINPFAGLIR